MKSRLNPEEILERHYLEARCQLLELGAFFDRYQRGGGGDPVVSLDLRLDRCVQAFRILTEEKHAPDRAEKLALLFSDTTPD